MGTSSDDKHLENLQMSIVGIVFSFYATLVVAYWSIYTFSMQIAAEGKLHVDSLTRVYGFKPSTLLRWTEGIGIAGSILFLFVAWGRRYNLLRKTTPFLIIVVFLIGWLFLLFKFRPLEEFGKTYAAPMVNQK